MKRLLTTVFCVCMAVVTVFLFCNTANAATDGIYTYTVSGGKATISDCDASVSGSIVIPSTLGGYPVTAIGSEAFAYCNSLTDITIPNCVTSIGYSAFLGCISLTSVTIGNRMTSIGSYAFQGCRSLTRILIPSSVTSIGFGAFRVCSSLTTIEVSAENPSYCSQDGVLFNKDCTELICCPGGKTGSYVIPNGVTSIGDPAFDGCSSLTSITIPDSVTSIGYAAFADCSSLTSITIPDGVTSIGNSAFWGCSSLTAIEVSAENPSYCSQDGVLFNKDCTELICCPGGKTGSYVIPNGVTSIGSYAFYSCSSLSSITIPDGVTSIGGSAFEYCRSLTSITIPDSVTGIGGSAFYGCSSLTSVTIPNSVTGIGNYAFSYCTSLTSITIPDGVTSIGNDAFRGCSSLTSITIPDGVTSIGESAFEYCRSLTSITIPDSVTSIDNYAFYGCTDLASVTIGNRVTSIGVWAFYDCSSLSAVHFLGDKPTIGNDAFANGSHGSAFAFYPKGNKTYPESGGNSDNLMWLVDGEPSDILASGTCGDGVVWQITRDGCLTISGFGTMNSYTGDNTAPWYAYRGGITQLLISPGIDNIGSYAFYNCSRITNVAIPDSVTSIGESAFSGCSSLTSITIPNSVTSIGGSAFEYCRSLTDIMIPASVTSIGARSFLNCSSLTSVTIPNSVTSIESWAFEGCNLLRDVYYTGSKTQWGKITISFGNEPLRTATIHYCEHNYESTVTPPSCTKIGYTTHICSICGDSYIDTYIGALGHDYKDTVIDPTCMEQGYTTHTCSRCEDSYVDSYVDALGHDFGAWTETKAATCTEKGEERRDCSRCDHYETREVEALGHDYKDAVTDPTCTGQGYTTHTCSRCDDSYVDSYVDELGHDFGAWTETKAATCTEKGEERRDCSRCEHYETREVEALGHNYKATVTDPTCTEQGYTTHTCSRCGDSYVDSYVDALGHDFGAWTETKAATCTEKGEERRDCSRCEHYETREVEALGHNYKATVTDPTCTEQGYTTHTCSRCGDSYVDSYVDALGHDFGAWTETKAATCTEKGEERRDCSRCDHYETREVEALGHDYKDAVTDPTCTEQGYTTHTCTRCNDSYADSYADALGHRFGQWVSNGDATEEKDGTKTRTCSVCGFTETETDVGSMLPATPWVNPYTDVKESAWYYDSVSFATNRGLFNGTSATTFGPNDEMTRAMFVTVLYRLDGSPAIDGGTHFTDIFVDAYYYDAVKWANANGIVYGTDADKFSPDASVTREQMVTFLYRYANYKGVDTGYEASLAAFTDANSVSDYALHAMAWSVGADVIHGSDGMLLPSGTATRAEVATMLKNYVLCVIEK